MYKIIRMRLSKKYLIFISSVVYTVILLHNITPHFHGSHIETQSSLLSDWFKLFFGSHHDKDIKEDTHLINFNIEENEYDYLNEENVNSPEFEFLPFYSLQNLILFQESSSFYHIITSFLNCKVQFYSSLFQNESFGRAPPSC